MSAELTPEELVNLDKELAKSYINGDGISLDFKSLDFDEDAVAKQNAKRATLVAAKNAARTLAEREADERAAEVAAKRAAKEKSTENRDNRTANRAAAKRAKTK